MRAASGGTVGQVAGQRAVGRAGRCSRVDRSLLQPCSDTMLEGKRGGRRRSIGERAIEDKNTMTARV